MIRTFKLRTWIGGLLACSLDLLGVDFLSVIAVIGITSHMALSVTDKR
jgi:hypothetical protein